MKVAVIGATGFVGKALLHELLDRDHMVIGIARHPEKLGFRHPGLSMKAGDVMGEGVVAALVKGQDAVISAYNPGMSDPNMYKNYLEGAQAILAGVKKSGVKRFIVSGGGDSLEVAARDYFDILKNEQELEWTFFSPVIFMNAGTSGKRRGVYRTGLDQPVPDKDGKSIISVEDQAVAIADELEHPKYIRQRFTAAY